MFSDAHYLENNAFSTSHQSVNVYGLPERRYEIRTEDDAVDIQIHRGVSEANISPIEVRELRKKNAWVKERHQDAVEVQVIGTYAGRYFIVPYEGKLKNFTTKLTTSMFILQMRSGKEKWFLYQYLKKIELSTFQKKTTRRLKKD